MIRPLIGAGGMTREAAHGEVQSILDRLAERDPYLLQVVDVWRRGAVDDTCSWGAFTWTIYGHTEGEDPRRAALKWLDDFAQIMRRAGLTDIQVEGMPPQDHNPS